MITCLPVQSNHMFIRETARQTCLAGSQDVMGGSCGDGSSILGDRRGSQNAIIALVVAGELWRCGGGAVMIQHSRKELRLVNLSRSLPAPHSPINE